MLLLLLLLVFVDVAGGFFVFILVIFLFQMLLCACMCWSMCICVMVEQHIENMYIYSLGLYVMPLAFLIRSFCFLSCSAIMWCMALATTKECNMCWFAFRFSFNSYVFVLHHPMSFSRFSRSVEFSLTRSLARSFVLFFSLSTSFYFDRTLFCSFQLENHLVYHCMVSALYFYVKSSFFLDMFVAKNQDTKTKPNWAKPSQMEHNRNERIEVACFVEMVYWTDPKSNHRITSTIGIRMMEAK